MIYNGTTEKELFLQCETIAEEFHRKHGSISEEEVSYELSEWYAQQNGVEEWYQNTFGLVTYDVQIGKTCDRIAEMYFHSKDYFNFEVRLQECERDEHERKLTEETLTRRSKQI